MRFLVTFRVKGDSDKTESELKKLFISIHTFHVEGDKHRYDIKDKRSEFQSTPSVWKVTVYQLCQV